MGRRAPNPQRAKIHNSYSVEEVARLFGIHRNTVRAWIKQGLPVCDDRRPVLVLGSHLRSFLQQRRVRNKRPCGPGQLYCVRCRQPRVPAGLMADYRPYSSTGGMLTGICPVCESMIHRRITLAKWPSIRGDLEVAFTQAHSRIGESLSPCVNRD